MVTSTSSFSIANEVISPATILAPMAGITHCSFRRLIADFGGYGALTTEMLSARSLLHENLERSTFTRRRKQEGKVIYQLRLTGQEPLKEIYSKLALIEPFAIDINLGCPAPRIKKTGGGCALFENINSLESVLCESRKHWKGILTIKCRLGTNTRDWQNRFLERLKLFHNCGIDAITLHPRFSTEKLKRTAKDDLYRWVRSNTTLPLIANGDICDAKSAHKLLSSNHVNAIMLGRIAVVRPWIFRSITDPAYSMTNYLEVWQRMYYYTLEDFRPEKAIGRIKEFTSYFAKNFLFGNELFRKVQSSPDLQTLFDRATSFLEKKPQIVSSPIATKF